MAEPGLDDRRKKVQELLNHAHKDAKAQQYRAAQQSLREALAIEPEDSSIHQALEMLKFTETSGDFSQILGLYLDHGQDGNARQLLQILNQSVIPAPVAIEAVGLILKAQSERPAINGITAALVANSVDARKALCSKVCEQPALLFDIFYDRGRESFRVLIGLPIDDALWVSKTEQLKLQRDILSLCCVKLKRPNVASPGLALEAIVRLLAFDSDRVVNIIDYDVVRTVLTFLDVRLESVIRSQATLTASKMLEVLQETGEEFFKTFITSNVTRQSKQEMILAFSAAAAMFPIIPTAATELFMTEGFLQQLLSLLEHKSSVTLPSQRMDAILERAALELLSAACVEKACRELIAKVCAPWLGGLSDGRSDRHQALATLILAKLGGSDQDTIIAQLTAMASQETDDTDQAIEGLAYMTLRPKVKEQVAQNDKLIKNLIKCMIQRPSVLFGCLTIFCNLSQYKAVRSEEDTKMAQLKAYANSSRPTPDDPLDSDARVTARCKKLLDADFVSALVACSKSTTSMTVIAVVGRILLAMAREQKHRPKLAQQGAVRLLLQIYDTSAHPDQPSLDSALVAYTAAHALARVLISVNPAHVFSSSLPPTSAVRCLAALLSDDNDHRQGSLLPIFECLLALTNLAAMEDSLSRDLEIRILWVEIENLLLSPNSQIQRACVELVCNLMASPAGIAKFADGSRDSTRRLQILLALADADDLATRRASGGALAMLTEWDAAVSAISQKPGGINRLLEMCADESEEVRHRGFVCIHNMINAPGSPGQESVNTIRNCNGSEKITTLLKNTRNAELLRLGIDILRKVKD